MGEPVLRKPPLAWWAGGLLGIGFGKKTRPEITGTNAARWVIPIVAIGTLVPWLTRPPRAATQ